MSGIGTSGQEILQFILEIIDSVAVALQIAQIGFYIIIALYILLYARDTFNVTWLSRMGILGSCFIWSIGVIFGMDHFWLLLGRINGKFNPNVINFLCGTSHILIFGIGQIGVTGILLAILGNRIPLDTKRKVQQNCYFVFIMFFFLSVFTFIQVVDFGLHIVLQNIAIPPTYDVFYSVNDVDSCKLPLSALLANGVYLVVFVIFYNIYSGRIQKAILNIYLVKRLYRAQILLSGLIFLQFFTRICQMLNLSKLLGLESFGVFIWGEVSHSFYLLAVIFDMLIMYAIIIEYVVKPLHSAQRSWRFRHEIRRDIGQSEGSETAKLLDHNQHIQTDLHQEVPPKVASGVIFVRHVSESGEHNTGGENHATVPVIISEEHNHELSQ
jgi:hypothetical protein